MHTKDLAHAGGPRCASASSWPGGNPRCSHAEHAARVSLIALINATNRLAVITRQPGGNHQPGQFG